MIYRIVHKTTYRYTYPVLIGNHVACLTPRDFPRHRCARHELRINPTAKLTRRTDSFGNQLAFFTIQRPHKRLVVEARSEVVTDEPTNSRPEQSMIWENLADAVANDRHRVSLEAYQFVFESPRVPPSPLFSSYASKSFTTGRQFVDALLDLTDRIHRDFRFDPRATNVGTSAEGFFKKRRGVSHDFAHLEIACLRSLKLPARFVSGYLVMDGPSGRPRRAAADRSHAWISAYCPAVGWLDVDATGNCFASENYVTLGWGRDYNDVIPVRGLILGGSGPTRRVSVDIAIMDA